MVEKQELVLRVTERIADVNTNKSREVENKYSEEGFSLISNHLTMRNFKLTKTSIFVFEKVLTKEEALAAAQILKLD